MYKNLEELETRKLLNQLVTMMALLIPEKFSISYLSDSTGKSRQALIKYLQRHHEEGVEWHKEGKKIYVNKDLGIKILQEHKVQELMAA